MTQALLVNPYSPEELADALAHALRMPLEERRERHRALLESVEREDVHWWLGKFLDALKHGGEDEGGADVISLEEARHHGGGGHHDEGVHSMDARGFG